MKTISQFGGVLLALFLCLSGVIMLCMSVATSLT